MQGAQVKPLVFILLFGLCTSAWAHWARIASHDEADVYADRASIVKQGKTVRMWSLFNYRVVQRRGEVAFLSHMTREEYDCAKERQRTLYFSMYSDAMGEGRRVYSGSEPGEWAPVPRGSIVEKLWRIACGQ
jgi:hypothetical protein